MLFTRKSAVLLLLAAQQASAASPSEPLNFYTPANDVTDHAAIDVDMKTFEDLLKSGDGPKWELAREIYEDGRNSPNGDKLRTLQGFSTGLPAKAETLKNKGSDLLPEFFMYKAYYNNSETYADDFVQGALAGTGDFEGLTDDARVQFAIKGAQYQNVWMYVLRELYEAVATCRTGSAAPKAWDEGLAFYTGSIVGPKAANIGVMLHALAQKRCGSFGLCSGDGENEPTASTNAEAVRAFKDGLEAVLSGDCDRVMIELFSIRKQMQIALIQGMLQYAYKSDVRVPSDNRPKAMAEAWAFSAGVLPMMAAASASAGQTIKSNMEYKTGVDQIVPNGYEELFEAVYEVLPLMCITCEEVGVNAFVTSAGDKPECVTNADVVEAGCLSVGLDNVADDDSDVNLAIVISVIGLCLVLMVLTGFCVHRVWKRAVAEEELALQQKREQAALEKSAEVEEDQSQSDAAQIV